MIQLVEVGVVKHKLALRHLAADELPKALAVNAQFVLVFEQGVLNENLDAGRVFDLQLLFEEVVRIDYFVVSFVDSPLQRVDCTDHIVQALEQLKLRLRGGFFQLLFLLD